MTALLPEQKERQRSARARAGRIREGMRNYIATLAEIYNAYVAGDWKTLGYASWEAYLAEEFGVDRVKLPAEQRLKALRELRLEDMPNRALAPAMNVDEKTVRRDRAAANAAPLAGEVVDLPARPPLVEAITGAIEDAAERVETYKLADENGPGYPCEGAEYGVCSGEPHTDDCPSSDRSVDTPIEAEPERGVATEPGTAAEESEAREREPSADPEPDLPPTGSGSPNPERIEEAVCPTCGKPRWSTA